MKKTSHPDCAVCNKRLAYQRALIQRWVANGLCRVCGVPCAPFTRCIQHRLKNTAWHVRKRRAA